MTPSERLAHDGHLIDILWARTLRRVTRTPEGCWRFNGAVTSGGYGCVGSGIRSQTITTHRLAVLHRDGFIPAGMTVDHQCHDTQTCKRGVRCEHRRCCNPAHLKVMTMAANNRRKVWMPPQAPPLTADELAALEAEKVALLALLFGESAA